MAYDSILNAMIQEKLESKIFSEDRIIPKLNYPE